MGTGHTIRCKHCGTEFMNLVGLGLMGFMGLFDCEDGVCHVETETAIRCPKCMKRLNNTQEEFEEQIIGSLCWD